MTLRQDARVFDCMLCLVDVFFSRVDIPMGTNSTPLLANLFLYSYTADFIQGASQEKRKEASPIL